MAWRRPGDKQLSESMMFRSLTHICVARPQWVNGHRQPLYWARGLNGPMLSTRKDFNNLCLDNVEKWQKMQIYLYFSYNISERQALNRRKRGLQIIMTINTNKKWASKIRELQDYLLTETGYRIYSSMNGNYLVQAVLSQTMLRFCQLNLRNKPRCNLKTRARLSRNWIWNAIWKNVAILPPPQCVYVVQVYHQISYISRTFVGNKFVDHSDVVGASPFGAAPTTSSFSTKHVASMDSAKTTARQDKTHLSFGIWCDLN